jgi:YHS domain-containing protein
MSETRTCVPRPAFAARLPAWLAGGIALLFSWAAAASPYNTTSDGADSSLMLKGHDPVAYFTLGRPALGKPDIKVAHDGVTYRFASEENKALFLKEPARYVPQYGGYCSNGIVYGIPWGGEPDTWKMIDGRLYIFGGGASMNYFLMDQKRNLDLADRYWKNEVDGSSALVQRYKRLIFRVPHYKTGAELEAEWQAKQSGKPAVDNALAR